MFFAPVSFTYSIRKCKIGMNNVCNSTVLLLNTNETCEYAYFPSIPSYHQYFFKSKNTSDEDQGAFVKIEYFNAGGYWIDVFGKEKLKANECQTLTIEKTGLTCRYYLNGGEIYWDNYYLWNRLRVLLHGHIKIMEKCEDSLEQCLKSKEEEKQKVSDDQENQTSVENDLYDEYYYIHHEETKTSGKSCISKSRTYCWIVRGVFLTIEILVINLLGCVIKKCCIN